MGASWVLLGRAIVGLFKKKKKKPLHEAGGTKLARLRPELYLAELSRALERVLIIPWKCRHSLPSAAQRCGYDRMAIPNEYTLGFMPGYLLVCLHLPTAMLPAPTSQCGLSQIFPSGIYLFSLRPSRTWQTRSVHLQFKRFSLQIWCSQDFFFFFFC